MSCACPLATIPVPASAHSCVGHCDDFSCLDMKTELPAVIVILSSATKEEPAVSISKMHARFHVREIAVYSLIVMRSAIVISIAKT